MLPLFDFFSYPIYLFPLFLSLAYFLTVFFWIKAGKRYSLSSQDIVPLSWELIFVTLVSAKLFFILQHFPEYWSGQRTLSLNDGGIVFYGGFIGAFVYIFLRNKKNKGRFFALINSLALALPLGHAIGRLGCLANGCCHGSRCELPWAIIYTHPLSVAEPKGLPLHPSQVYEIIGLILIFLYSWFAPRRPFKLKPASFYLITYALLRFLVEWTRGDTLRGFYLGLSTSQWIALFSVLLALFLDSKERSGHKKAL